ncbi:MAG TPA: TetR-like C-terminal domain-containing protein [Candidatus Eremiobacteraceae bacterium]|nr:TetR-like C-terminal domain-containing protein [Candidatus Eremiobacteraceae bacterium]
MGKKRRLTKSAILVAAAHIADQSSSGDVTLLELAAKLGVKMPSLYNHLQGQNGLRQELAVYAIEQLRAALTNVALGRSSAEAIRAMCSVYLDFSGKHPGLYRAMLRLPDPNEKQLRAANHRVLQLLLTILAPYRLSKADAIHAVRTWRAMLHGFVSLEMTGAFSHLPRRFDSFQFMVAMFVKSLDSRRLERTRKDI